METRNYSLYHTFQHNAKTIGNNPAFISTKGTVTYSQFLDRADHLAAGFTAQGIVKGDRVCILSQNSIEYMELIAACAKTGAIAFPINWRLSAVEIQGVVALAEPKMLVVEAGYLQQLEETDPDKAEEIVVEKHRHGITGLETLRANALTMLLVVVVKYTEVIDDAWLAAFQYFLK